MIDPYDYDKIKLGLLSILWRMSLTEKEEYNTVQIGCNPEKEIRKMLWRKNPGCADKFSIVLLGLTDYIGQRSSLGTSSNKFADTIMWNLGLPGFVAVIKIGRDIDPHAFQCLIMSPNQPLTIACKDNLMEADWKGVIDAIKQKTDRNCQKPT